MYGDKGVMSRYERIKLLLADGVEKGDKQEVMFVMMRPKRPFIDPWCEATCLDPSE
jgi:hypothetical protein